MVLFCFPFNELHRSNGEFPSSGPAVTRVSLAREESCRVKSSRGRKSTGCCALLLHPCRQALQKPPRVISLVTFTWGPRFLREQGGLHDDVTAPVRPSIPPYVNYDYAIFRVGRGGGYFQRVHCMDVHQHIR